MLKIFDAALVTAMSYSHDRDTLVSLAFGMWAAQLTELLLLPQNKVHKVIARRHRDVDTLCATA